MHGTGVQIIGNEGTALRISEAYEHAPILPYQPEESCPVDGCGKVSTQCVDVAATVTLAPTAVMGSPTVSCQGTPAVTCTTNQGGTSCTVVLKQQVCVTIPVSYGVTMTTGEPTIACAENGGGCSCGCR